MTSKNNGVNPIHAYEWTRIVLKCNVSESDIEKSVNM